MDAWDSLGLIVMGFLTTSAVVFGFLLAVLAWRRLRRRGSA